MSQDTLPCFLMVAVPKRDGEYEKLHRGVNADVHPINIPQLRCGTLDDLMSLSDDLEKTEAIVEKATKRIGSVYYRFVEETQKEIKLKQVLMVGSSEAEHYVCNFRWDDSKYPLKHSCKDIAGSISKDCGEFEDTFKKQVTEFSEIEHEIQQLRKKEQGNLMLKDLSSVVKPQHFVDSEYLKTLLVVVPKHSKDDWFKSFESLMPVPDPPQPPPVVPRSSVEVAADDEFVLVTVVVLRLVENEFKQAARTKRFIVRDYTPNPDGEDSQAQLSGLSRKREEMRSDLIVWCRTTFTDVFAGWIHLKVIRLFVEAVLRFGLPANFCNALVRLMPKKEKSIRSELGSLYRHLSSSMMNENEDEDADMAAAGMGKKIYPYVSLTLDMDLD
uniref:V-type proton ATPase subunit C n=2 Tax=Paramoeba aestuarina TaxID=180227 RepID=A0A6U3CKJ0_9EUKA|mmetsp:Transcript_38441/g.60913  ORF Transcript_38441/g.60913 Transcript_38441/m.60913 type:complete len:385 (+) Transcript_38441:80-1234(+)